MKRYVSAGLVLFGFALSFVNMACSSAEKTADTPEGLIEIAREYEKDERYEEAIRRFNDIRTRFPYSSVAVEAELAVADCNFKQESFPEAQAGYQAFKELHPKHAKIAYVIYRLGLSYFNQLPDTVDRDLSLAENTIASFDEVINGYATTEYVPDAKEKRLKAYELLAGHEQYVADFYLKKEIFKSAASRYEYILAKYPGIGFDERALVGAARASFRLGEHSRAKVHYDALKAKYPQSAELSAVQSELGL